MSNIKKIEEVFLSQYNKVLSILPKLNELIENTTDLKSNINYGLDQLHLEDNIVCDENLLMKNMNSTLSNLENFVEVGTEKFSKIDTIKSNYKHFIELLEEEKNLFEELKYLIYSHQQKTLDKNIELIGKNCDKEISFKIKKLNES